MWGANNNSDLEWPRVAIRDRANYSKAIISQMVLLCVKFGVAEYVRDEKWDVMRMRNKISWKLPEIWPFYKAGFVFIRHTKLSPTK